MKMINFDIVVSKYIFYRELVFLIDFYLVKKYLKLKCLKKLDLFIEFKIFTQDKKINHFGLIIKMVNI